MSFSRRGLFGLSAGAVIAASVPETAVPASFGPPMTATEVNNLTSISMKEAKRRADEIMDKWNPVFVRISQYER